jgi:hypothetical protein
MIKILKNWFYKFDKFENKYPLDFWIFMSCYIGYLLTKSLYEVYEGTFVAYWLNLISYSLLIVGTSYIIGFLKGIKK